MSDRGFEARRWRSSHLNQRRRGHRHSVVEVRACERRDQAWATLVSRLVAGAPRTSTSVGGATDTRWLRCELASLETPRGRPWFRGSSLALLAPQPASGPRTWRSEVRQICCRWRPPVERIASASSLERRIRRRAGCSSVDAGTGASEADVTSAAGIAAAGSGTVARRPCCASLRVHMWQGWVIPACRESSILANCEEASAGRATVGSRLAGALHLNQRRRQSARSTITGAWSEAPLPARSSRSMNAPVTSFAKPGFPSTKSIRIPRLRSKRCR